MQWIGFAQAYFRVVSGSHLSVLQFRAGKSVQSLYLSMLGLVEKTQFAQQRELVCSRTRT